MYRWGRRFHPQAHAHLTCPSGGNSAAYDRRLRTPPLHERYGDWANLVQDMAHDAASQRRRCATQHDPSRAERHRDHRRKRGALPRHPARLRRPREHHAASSGDRRRHGRANLRKFRASSALAPGVGARGDFSVLTPYVRESRRRSLSSESGWVYPWRARISGQHRDQLRGRVTPRTLSRRRGTEREREPYLRQNSTSRWNSRMSTRGRVLKLAKRRGLVRCGPSSSGSRICGYLTWEERTQSHG